MRTLEELRQFYDNDLINDLRLLEGVRKRTLYKLLGCTGAVAAAFVALLLLFGVLALAGAAPPEFAIVALVVGGVVCLVVWLVAGYYIKRGYIGGFKGTIIGKLVAFIDPQLQYRADGMVPGEQYHASKIFKHGVDRYSGEDLVSGAVGKTALQFSELHTQYKTTYTDSKGHRHTQWHTIFRGIFFVADFNKHFSGETVVLTDTAEKMFGGWLGQKLQGMNAARENLIKLEDAEFEKMFVVYATDQIEARYILSTSLIARITDYRKKANKEIQLAFSGGQMYVAISYAKDLFEPRVFRTILDFAPIREYYDDLALALGLVEELNLNTRIWSKQ